MLAQKDGAPQAQRVRRPYQKHLYRPPWYHSSARVFVRSAAPRQPSSARPPPYHASCGKRPKWSSCKFIINRSGSTLWFQSSPLLRRELTGRHRAHWPSSRILAHESSVIKIITLLDIKTSLHRSLLFGELFLCFSVQHTIVPIQPLTLPEWHFLSSSLTRRARFLFLSVSGFTIWHTVNPHHTHFAVDCQSCPVCPVYQCKRVKWICS